MKEEKQELLMPIDGTDEVKSNTKFRKEYWPKARKFLCLVLVCTLCVTVLDLILIGAIKKYRANKKFEASDPKHPIMRHRDMGDRTTIPLAFISMQAEDRAKQHLVMAKHGAVSCDVPICSKLGTDILKRGGSAVDASITTALCLGSINSFSSGLGGSGVMVVKPTDEKATSFNFLGKAGRYAHKDMFKENPMLSKSGGLSVTVPGELAGLYEAYTRFSSGRLSWAELIYPVVELNRYGFVMDDALSIVTQTLAASADNGQPELRDSFDWLFNDKGEPLGFGDRVYRPKLANTLNLIALNGSAAIFYDPEGPIAPNLVQAVRRTGGVLTLEDFKDYNVTVGPALTGHFRGREVSTAPNPASGPILINGLNILDGFEQPEPESGDFEAVSTQRLIETMKWMGASRSQLGDPVDVDNSALIKRILSTEWADTTRAKISDNITYLWQFYNPEYEVKNSHGSVHFSVIDADGMAVSMTTTINLVFGSLVVDPATGIVLNNEMDNFSTPGSRNEHGLEESIYNYIAPFKRPISPSVPTVITNLSTNRAELIIGSGGGSSSLTSVVQAIVRKLDYNMPLLKVIQAIRIHHQLLPDVVFIEPVILKSVTEEIIKCGHTIDRVMPTSTINGIYVDPVSGVIHAVSDFWRNRGDADGY